MKDLFNQLRKIFKNRFLSILTFVVATYVTATIIEPLSHILNTKIIGILASISQYFSNDLYRSIAHASLATNSQVFSSTYLFLFVIFISTVFYLLLRFDYEKDEEDYYEGNDESDSTEQNTTQPSATSAIPVLPKDNKEADNISDKESSNSIKKKKKFLYFLNILFVCLFVIQSIFIVEKQSIITSTYSAFTSNIEIITPYIDTHVIDTFRSDFRLINTKSDFTNIDNQMQVVANEFGLQLHEYPLGDL